jgi:hypothetical protein
VTFPPSLARPLGRQLCSFSTSTSSGTHQPSGVPVPGSLRWRWGTLGYNVSKAAAIGVVLFWNFGFNRIWTYRNIR